MSVASFIASQRAEHGVPHAKSCRFLDVSVSWFYKWHDRPPTAREQRRSDLDAKVTEVFSDSGGVPSTYGSPRVHAELATGALKMAAAVRGGDVRGVVFHSDKGPGEYTASLFEDACAALGVVQSMGRVGSCFDNAAAESFNSTLEFELLSRCRFETKAQARRAVAMFIDAYNTTRRHSSCEMRAPVDFETILAQRATDAREAA
jgi:transposase InsO family protein